MKHCLFKYLNQRVIQYFDYEKRDYFTEAFCENQKNLSNNLINGQLSPKASASLKKFVTLWITAIECYMFSRNIEKKYLYKYITFVTLTLSAQQIHSDQYIKRYMLNRFLQILKRNHNVSIYLYVAECQENGNIHFHILVNKPIPWQKIRAYWNDIQADSGYLDRFEKKYSHRDPNSTDIHALSNINFIDRYLIKYMTKSIGRWDVFGRVWGKSDNLLEISPFIFDDSRGYYDDICELYSVNNHRTYLADHFSIINTGHLQELAASIPILAQSIVDHYVTEFHQLYNTAIHKQRKFTVADNDKSFFAKQKN